MSFTLCTPMTTISTYISVNGDFLSFSIYKRGEGLFAMRTTNLHTCDNSFLFSDASWDPLVDSTSVHNLPNLGHFGGRLQCKRKDFFTYIDM